MQAELPNLPPHLEKTLLVKTLFAMKHEVEPILRTDPRWTNFLQKPLHCPLPKGNWEIVVTLILDIRWHLAKLLNHPKASF